MADREKKRLRAKEYYARRKRLRLPAERDDGASDSEPEHAAASASDSGSGNSQGTRGSASVDSPTPSEADGDSDVDAVAVEHDVVAQDEQEEDNAGYSSNGESRDSDDEAENSLDESSIYDQDSDSISSGSESGQDSDRDSESEEDQASSAGESANESEEDEDGIEEGNEPIYPEAPITLSESLLAIFTFMVTQNVSGTVLQQVLQLIALHCPAHSIIKRTLKTFKSYFSKIGSALLIKHYICADCIFPLKTKDSVCKKCKKSGLNATFFIELPLLPQLQCLFSKRGFYEDLQFRFKADRKRTPDNVEDIYDGNIYKAEMDSGFLRDPNNVSFMWYSDGIKVFKSSAFSVWPLCLAINELPYKKRSDPDNILLVGLWFGKNKPNPNLFLRPLLKTMKKFETDGHSFKLPDNSDILVKGKVLCGTCDLPAKSKFLQFKQFNGAYGCGQCMQEGGRAVAGKTTVQVYPYTPNVPKRTHVETQRFAQQALEARARDKNASVNGVKGPSLVSKLVPDIIRCTAIDVMHGVFLGVCKMLLNLWFSPSFSNQPWSLHHLQDVVDEKLKKIKPPSYAARAPRSLKDIKFWKASEYKLFLLYYSVPLLHGVMEENYLRHHCKLVSAIALLCQDSIFFAQIRLASDLLKSYVGDFAGLYSIRYVGINVHQLVHLGDVVIDLGPLWVYSCFFLENFNGTLNKLFHGTQHIALQICSAVSMMMQMPTFMRRLPPDSIALQYCAKLTDGSKPLKIADVIDDCTYAVGNYCYERNEIDHSRQVLRQCFNLAAGSFKVFYRLKFKGVVYVSKEYPIQSLRNESSYVKICDGDLVRFGRIIRFVKWSNCGNLCDVDCVMCPVSYYAIVSLMQTNFWFAHDIRDVRFPYIFNVEITDNVIAIDIKSIISLCFCYDVDNNMFLCSPINRLENE